MGQALRRASGRVPPSAASSSPAPKPPPPPPPPPRPKRAEETPSVSGAGAATPPQDQLSVSDSDTTVSAKDDHGSVLEERDPSYDKMLSFMVGRITTKSPVVEQKWASVKERYDRPLPKVRTSKTNDEDNTHRHLTPGTLSVEHIRQIILLHQGKSENQQEPMATTDIAKRFQVDVTVIETIVQSISLPAEDTNKKPKE